MHCANCGLAPKFGRLVAYKGGAMCEYCEDAIVNILGFTLDEWYTKTINHWTVQVAHAMGLGRGTK